MRYLPDSEIGYRNIESNVDTPANDYDVDDLHNRGNVYLPASKHIRHIFKQDDF